MTTFIAGKCGMSPYANYLVCDQPQRGLAGLTPAELMTGKGVHTWIGWCSLVWS